VRPPSPTRVIRRSMTGTLSSSGDALETHLRSCLVQVLVGGRHAGTGFFVAPGKLLTCAHVVMGEGKASILWEGQTCPARILRRLPDRMQVRRIDPYPHPDLALLAVEVEDHPCVRLDEREPALGPPPDRFRTAGFTDVFERGVVRLTPMTCEFEGTL